MLSLPTGTRSVPVILPLAVVFPLAVSLGSACSSRGSQLSSAPEQLTEAPRQEPVEHDNSNGAPAQPLLVIESSPPGSSRLHLAVRAGDLEQVKQLLDQGYKPETLPWPQPVTRDGQKRARRCCCGFHGGRGLIPTTPPPVARLPSTLPLKPVQSRFARFFLRQGPILCFLIKTTQLLSVWPSRKVIQAWSGFLRIQI